MTDLTRRKDPERPDRWTIRQGDIGIGSIGRRAGADRSERVTGSAPAKPLFNLRALA
jgi:hypothetical protein